MLSYVLLVEIGTLIPGDLIMEIDGIDTRGLQVHDVTEKLRGLPSSEVNMVNSSISCFGNYPRVLR
jgi:C-terminal processing protease CtpA/Prc